MLCAFCSENLLLHRHLRICFGSTIFAQKSVKNGRIRPPLILVIKKPTDWRKPVGFQPIPSYILEPSMKLLCLLYLILFWPLVCCTLFDCIARFPIKIFNCRSWTEEVRPGQCQPIVTPSWFRPFGSWLNAASPRGKSMPDRSCATRALRVSYFHRTHSSKKFNRKSACQHVPFVRFYRNIFDFNLVYSGI